MRYDAVVLPNLLRAASIGAAEVSFVVSEAVVWVKKYRWKCLFFECVVISVSGSS